MAKVMMALFFSGPVAGEILTVEDGEVVNAIAYSIHPDPHFTALDGGQNVAYLYVRDGTLPLGAEEFDEERFNAHLVELRRKAGVTFEAAYAAHHASYPREAERDAEAARDSFPA